VQLSLVLELLSGISGTEYWIDANLPLLSVANSVIITNSTVGANLTHADVDLLALQILNASVGVIPIIIVSADVDIVGWGTDFCGYHDFVSASGVDLPYVFVGAGHEDGCSYAGKSTSVFWATTLIHELAETLKDPFLNGTEYEDPCAWQLPPIPGGPDGYCVTHNITWNANVSGLLYLLQPLWHPGTGSCSMGTFACSSLSLLPATTNSSLLDDSAIVSARVSSALTNALPGVDVGAVFNVTTSESGTLVLSFVPEGNVSSAAYNFSFILSLLNASGVFNGIASAYPDTNSTTFGSLDSRK